MTEPKEVGVATITEACDQLVARVEDYLQELWEEQPIAEQSDDYRYQYRVTRGIGWSEELLEMLDDVFELIGTLRHNHNQLRWSREGKLV